MSNTKLIATGIFALELNVLALVLIITDSPHKAAVAIILVGAMYFWRETLDDLCEQERQDKEKGQEGD